MIIFMVKVERTWNCGQKSWWCHPTSLIHYEYYGLIESTNKINSLNKVIEVSLN